MDLSPDGAPLYVATSRVSSYTQYFPGSVTVIDTARYAIVDTIAVSLSPDTVTVSPDGSLVLVTHYDTNSISAIDVERRSVTSVFLPDAPLRAVVTPDGTGVYVIGMQSLFAVDFLNKIARSSRPGGCHAGCSSVATASEHRYRSRVFHRRGARHRHQLGDHRGPTGLQSGTGGAQRRRRAAVRRRLLGRHPHRISIASALRDAEVA